MILARPMGLVRVIRPAAPFSSLSELPALRVVDLLVRVAGKYCEGSDTSATFHNCLEDGLQDSLFGSTEHAEVKDSRQVDRLLKHVRPSKN